MHCPQCRTENPVGASFCGNCGVQLESAQPHPHDAAPHSGSRPGAGDIPARDLGQLITATFALYRRAAVPLFIIALVPQVPNVVNLQPDSAASLLLSLVSILLAVASGAAGIFCVGNAMTGRSTDVLDCYGRAASVFLPVLGAVVIITLALLGSAALMLIIIGIPLFFYLVVIWSFATQAVVIENKGVFSALGRSRELVRGSWWRVFGIGLVFALIFVPLILAIVLISFFIGLVFDPGTLAFGIIGGVFAALVTPVYYIASTLLYLDLRVRKEGYDLQALAADLSRRPPEAR